MLKLSWKKAIIAGAALTVLCASAFAAEEAAKPTMKQRVNAILNDDSACPPDGPLYDGGRRGGGLHRAPGFDCAPEEWAQKSPEERRQLREEWRKDWMSKTPEERQQLRQEWEQKRQQIAKEKMDKLSPEQKAEVEKFLKDDMERRSEMRQRMQAMTPEQRDAIRASRGYAGGYFHAGGHHGYHGHRAYKGAYLR